MSKSDDYGKMLCDEDLQDQVERYLDCQLRCKMCLELTKQWAHEAVKLVDSAYRKMGACRIGFWTGKISFGILVGLIVVVYAMVATALFGYEFDFVPLKMATFYLWLIGILICLGLFWGTQKYLEKAKDDFYAANREACETMNSMMENRRKAEHWTYVMADLKEKNPQIAEVLGPRDELNELKEQLINDDAWHEEYQYVRSHALWQQDWRKSADIL